MRAGLDAATRALYLGGDFFMHTRLRVANSDGTLRDLQGRYVGGTLQKPNPNAPIGTLTVDLLREVRGGQDSLSPLVTASALNRLADGVTFDPLLQAGHLVTFDVALTRHGVPRPADVSPLWYEVFRGGVSKVSWPKRKTGGVATIVCRDIAGLLATYKSEQAHVYAAGLSLEVLLRAILDNNGFGYVPLEVPVPTGKVIDVRYEPGAQKKVWDQVWGTAQANAYMLWMKYRADGTPALHLFQPPRGKTVVDATIARLHDFTSLDVDEEEIRNVGYVAFINEAGTQEVVGPLVDGVSVAKYGGPHGVRRPYWIAYGKESTVRTRAAAEAVNASALSDVSEPDVIATATTPPLIFGDAAEDLYLFPADPAFFTEDQALAPFAISVDFRAEEEYTSKVSLRGRPSAGRRAWQQYVVPEGQDPTFNPGVTFDVRVDADTGAVTVTPNAVNEEAQSWRFRLTVAPTRQEAFTDPVFNDAQPGEYAGTAWGGILDTGVALREGQSAYVSGWAFSSSSAAPADQEAARRSRTVHAWSTHVERGITRVDPTHPLTDGRYLGTLDDIFAAVNVAIEMAQSFTFDFDAESGDGGTAIDKIRTQPVFDPTGLIELVNTKTREIKAMLLGGDVTDAYSRAVGAMLGKASPADPDDARGLRYVGGTTLESLRPGEAGANVTETRTASDVQTGTGKAVREFGAEATTGKDLSVLTGRTAAKLQYDNGFTVEQFRPGEAGANITETRTAADTGKVNGTLAATVQGGAARANTGLNADGTVGPDKVANINAVSNFLVGNEAAVRRLFADNVFGKAIFGQLLAGDVGAVRKMVVREELVAGDVFIQGGLAALSAILGEVVAGCILSLPRINNPGAGIRISGDPQYELPSSVTNMIDMTGFSTWFLKCPFLELPFGPGPGRRAKFNGDIEAENGSFGGTLKASSVIVEGGKSLQLARSPQRGLAVDGQYVTFDTPFPAGTVPIVLLGGGGVSHDSSLTGGVYGQQFQALDVTNVGFMPSLKIVSTSGTPVPRSIGFSGSTATKATGGEAVGKTYTIRYDVTVLGTFGATQSYVTIGFYAGGVLRATRSYANTGSAPESYTGQEMPLTVSGMGIGSQFKVEVIGSGGTGGSVSPTDVIWMEAAVEERSAAAPGSGFNVPYLAIGGA